MFPPDKLKGKYLKTIQFVVTLYVGIGKLFFKYYKINCLGNTSHIGFS